MGRQGRQGEGGPAGSPGAQGPQGDPGEDGADADWSDINAAPEKTTPVDADLFGILDSAASFVLKKLTWANIKALLTLPITKPSDNALLAWNFDPSIAINYSTLGVKAQAYGVRLTIPKAMTISNLIICLAGTQGAGLVNCYAALYQNGALLGQTSDQSTPWQTTGNKVMAITPVAVQAGYIDIIFWCNNWTTSPSWARSTTLPVINVGLSDSDLRYFKADTGLSTTAPSTLGTKTALNTAFWAGVS